MTRRPPRRAPCLARHYQVTMRASVNVLAQANLDRNFPSGMGDRRVGTGMPCEVCRLVDQDCLRQSSLTVTRKGSSMHSIFDDSGSLGVLSTPIKTRWKGLLARRKLYICRQLGVRQQYQPVALLKIKFGRPE